MFDSMVVQPDKLYLGGQDCLKTDTPPEWLTTFDYYPVIYINIQSQRLI